jgi:hypothetical protein
MNRVPAAPTRLISKGSKTLAWSIAAWQKRLSDSRASTTDRRVVRSQWIKTALVYTQTAVAISQAIAASTLQTLKGKTSRVGEPPGSG